MMKIKAEYELNRAWIYDENENTIGEINFVVPEEWLVNTFEKTNSANQFVCTYKSFEDFIEAYEPETDGELIYQLAVKDGVLIEDLGAVLYDS